MVGQRTKDPKGSGVVGSSMRGNRILEYCCGHGAAKLNTRMVAARACLSVSFMVCDLRSRAALTCMRFRAASLVAAAVIGQHGPRGAAAGFAGAVSAMHKTSTARDSRQSREPASGGVESFPRFRLAPPLT